jgi:hypothetical protein
MTDSNTIGALTRRLSSNRGAFPASLPLAITGAQIRAARALLKWSGRDLADRCGVSYPAIQRAESVDDTPNMQVKNLMAIKAALEAGGVVFMDRGLRFR